MARSSQLPQNTNWQMVCNANKSPENVIPICEGCMSLNLNDALQIAHCSFFNVQGTDIRFVYQPGVLFRGASKIQPTKKK